MIRSILKRFRVDNNEALKEEAGCYIFDANMDVALMDTSRYTLTTDDRGQCVRLDNDVLFIVPKKCVQVAEMFERFRPSFTPGRWAMVTRDGDHFQFDTKRECVLRAQELGLSDDEYFVDYI